MITLTYLEFYSGIGGWGYALEHACRSTVQANTAVVAASTVAGGATKLPQITTVPSPCSKKPKLLSLDDDDDDDGDVFEEGNGVYNAGGKMIPSPFELRAQLLAAYDHSDLCNSVFTHNHINYDDDATTLTTSTATTSSNSNTSPSLSSTKQKQTKNKNSKKQYKPRQTPIERLTLTELQSHSASVWCMSPPCQPHTRQHSNQHLEREDPRSKSFVHLCSLLSEMEEETLPNLILLENVVGFEKSCWVEEDEEKEGGGEDGIIGDDTNDHQRAGKKKQQQVPTSSSSNKIRMGSFEMWRRTLSKRNYEVGHFHLDPTHVGIPNTRPRHYTVAFRRSTSDEALLRRLTKNGVVMPSSPSLTALKEVLPFEFSEGTKYDNLFSKESLEEPPIIHNEKSIQEVEGMAMLPELPCVNTFLDADISPHGPSADGGSVDPSPKETSLQIPEKVRTSSSSWCFDIATPHHRRSSCFTHSYGKFIRGTGSILYTGPLSRGGGAADDDNDKSVNANNEKDGTTIAATATTKTANLPSIDRFQLERPEERQFDSSWSDDLDWDRHVRYFSGTEIARLMGFPVAEPPAIATTARGDDDARKANGLDDGKVVEVVSIEEGGSMSVPFRKFSFPSDITVKRQWKLLGNSLNVRVAGRVAEIGIRSILSELGGGENENNNE